MNFLPRDLISLARHLVIAALVLPAVYLLAFGPRQEDQLPRDRIVVDYWEKWTGEEAAGMQQIVDDFNHGPGAQKGIYVRYLSTSSVDQKTLVATAAGVPPDIAGVWDSNVPQFAALHALTRLEGYAQQHHIDGALYKDAYWQECHYNGRLYALPSSTYDIGLYYNTAAFADAAVALRAAGLDPGRAPRTITELDAYAKILDRRGPAGNYLRFGYLPTEPGWYLQFTVFWFGGEWWHADTHRFDFTSPPMERAYEWLEACAKRMGPKQMSEFQAAAGNYDSPQNAFLAQTVAMEQQGTFFAPYIDRLNPALQGHWAAAPFPSVDPSLVDVTYCNADVFVIPRGAKHPREAFEFMAFANSQTEAEKLARLHGKISPLKRVSDGFFVGHPNPFARMFDRLAAGPNAHPTPSVPILPEATDALANFTQSLLKLHVNVHDGLADVQARVQAKYQTFMQRHPDTGDSDEPIPQ